MSKNSKCDGHCKSCQLLGECPEDTTHCDACGETIEPGCGVEVETEGVEHGRHYPMTVTVCQECYERFYLSDNLNDLIY